VAYRQTSVEIDYTGKTAEIVAEDTVEGRAVRVHSGTVAPGQSTALLSRLMTRPEVRVPGPLHHPLLGERSDDARDDSPYDNEDNNLSSHLHPPGLSEQPTSATQLALRPRRLRRPSRSPDQLRRPRPRFRDRSPQASLRNTGPGQRRAHRLLGDAPQAARDDSSQRPNIAT
jgi:hypothetical protein